MRLLGQAGSFSRVSLSLAATDQALPIAPRRDAIPVAIQDAAIRTPKGGTSTIQFLTYKLRLKNATLPSRSNPFTGSICSCAAFAETMLRHRDTVG